MKLFFYSSIQVFKCDCRVDQYGFERSEDFNYESYEELMSKHLAAVARRSKKWSKLLQDTVKVEKNVKGRLFFYYFILLN